ncbi:MAG TPA: XylR family transcriptional regulator [Phycisphaerae bacterium]|jgi:LacI family transcriptional regulator|nr:XylR family transcriptional regulator [Phycisphaerae bacterium]
MRRVLVESSYGSIWRELMEGITFYVRAQHTGWHLHSVTTEEIAGGLRRKVDGLLCLLPRARAELIEAVGKSRIPAVNMLRDGTPVIPSVLSDHEAIGQRGAEYFLEKGYRRFGFVGVNRDWSAGRWRGFSRRLRERGRSAELLEFPLAGVEERVGSSGALMRTLREWLEGLRAPAAVMACADFVSRAVLDACARQPKLRVPEDVAILGVDNDPAICELTAVTLSSIPQNLPRIGFEASRLLDGLMKKRRKPREALRILPREVVVRRSTELIAAEDKQVAAALRLIHEWDPGELTMKRLVENVGVSRQWLDRRFKQVLGRTPSEEIRQRKLKEARKLLSQTSLTVQEVAMRCGFSQGENLSRFFNDWLGMSPSEFRKRYGAQL